MTYVIAQPCVDVKDRACVEECPVDCIYEGARSLYIHPDECVDCGACEPVCPVEAIYYEDDVPAEWAAYYDANVHFFDDLGSPGGAAKMGVIGFTRSLAAEVGKYGITVNTITVGLTATQNAGTSSVMSPLLEHIIPAQAVHRADEPEDIANVVAFLALPASGIITGQTINVDGGVARH